jgi:hypothetical protein
VGFLVAGEASGTCVATAADLLARGVIALGELTSCWGDTNAYWPADVDGDGVNEILRADGGGLVAWSLRTGAAEIVWTPVDDAREEPFLDVVPDAFGPGRAAVVLGPDPVAIYALD